MCVTEDFSMKTQCANITTMSIQTLYCGIVRSVMKASITSQIDLNTDTLAQTKMGADIYPGCAPYNEELEETFKAKTAIPVKIPTDPQPEAQPEDQPLVVEDQPQEVEDQPQQVSQIETEMAVGNIAESGTDILNRLAAGQVIGNVED